MAKKGCLVELNIKSGIVVVLVVVVLPVLETRHHILTGIRVH